jgi:hypothetical protein
MCRENAHQRIFHDETDHQLLIDGLAVTVSRFGWEPFSMVLNYTFRGVNCVIEKGRAKLHPSRHRHSARTEARPPGLSQRYPHEVSSVCLRWV